MSKQRKQEMQRKQEKEYAVADRDCGKAFSSYIYNST